MSSSVRNLVIAIVIILVLGGVAYTRLSVTEQGPSENVDEGTSTPVEPPTEPDEEETQNEETVETPTEPPEEEPEAPPVDPELEPEPEPVWTPTSGWWRERQVPMYSNLATVMVTGAPYPTGEYTQERYLDIMDQMGVTVASWFDYMWKPINNDEWPEYIDLMHDTGRYVVGTDSMITTWKMGPDPPMHDASICLDPYGNKVTSNYGLSGTISEESVWYIHTTIHPDWQEYLLDGMKRNIDAGVDGYLIDELCYSAVLEPDFSEYTMTQFKLYLDEALTESEKNSYRSQFGLST